MKRSACALVTAVLCVTLAGCATSNDGVPGYVVDSTDFPGPGHVLVDGAGDTLYVYLPDQQGASRCVSACAKAWPPLLLPRGVRHPVAGRGVDAALLGVSRRPNGSRQVTYDRWPLYLYIEDARGQANGQAEGMGAWYLLSTSGAVDRQPLRGIPGG
ncbi:MAG: hypothetical protein ACLPVF_14655 [Acidimicrobiales bacterium]